MPSGLSHNSPKAICSQAVATALINVARTQKIICLSLAQMSLSFLKMQIYTLSCESGGFGILVRGSCDRSYTASSGA